MSTWNSSEPFEVDWEIPRMINSINFFPYIFPIHIEIGFWPFSSPSERRNRKGIWRRINNDYWNKYCQMCRKNFLHSCPPPPPYAVLTTRNRNQDVKNKRNERLLCAFLSKFIFTCLLGFSALSWGYNGRAWWKVGRGIGYIIMMLFLLLRSLSWCCFFLSLIVDVNN